MSLNAKSKTRIRKLGGRITTAEEWLDLTPEEIAVVDMRIRLGEEFRAHRLKRKLTQDRAASLLETSQGRISKLEKGQATLDQLAKSVLALGGSVEQVARAISG
jgi:predicted XRE-type DNA-binding protein